MAGPKEPTIAASFIAHLRQSSRISCPLTGCGETFPGGDDRIRGHLQLRHRDMIEGKDLNNIVRDIKRGCIPPGSLCFETSDAGPSSLASIGRTDDAVCDLNKRHKSPVDSPVRQTRGASNLPPRRSRARPPQNTAADDPDFLRRGPQQGKLWDPDDSPSLRSTKPPSSRPLKSASPQRRADPPDEDSDTPRLIKQPETRPISQEQLVAEVKGIYASLMMVESKCIEVDNALSAQSDTKLNNEQWQALIALHRTLLHEHHDFFLASQHPSASQALRRLALKYAMPARMWRYGIHSFLELLRHRLPGDLDHMLTFIYLAYSMMALLYETVPAFEDTWIECLGDLGRYRMAIEDSDLRDREVWTSPYRCLKDAPTPQISVHSSSYKPPSDYRVVGQFPVLDVGPDYSSTNPFGIAVFQHSENWLPILFPSLFRHTKQSLKYYLLSFVPSLAYITVASATTGRSNLVPESRQLAAPSTVNDRDSLAWLWYPTIFAGILVGEFAAVHIMGEPLLLHGVSMGISAGAYLLMVFSQQEIPFHIQFRQVFLS
ncbi:hypothetical protein E0Z10_g644 [Xylaria hypoxylon]|uniref:DNA/RNA-binding domain-containing protein n=1 Tax=Xylaria hypoxylon TaxID=37992 RepID=A0A4Z0ZAT0_9PEZI|nr:hypothetical protein E0Z10_g644 [Xylaria hypoxylon]